MFPLPGSGWCERAERLISDRLDGALDTRDEARLDVHLRNCPRCVEHERRLVQATDALLGGSPAMPAAALRRSPAAAGLPAAPTEAIKGGPALPLAWAAVIVVSLVLALAALALVLAGAL